MKRDPGVEFMRILACLMVIVCTGRWKLDILQSFF